MKAIEKDYKFLSVEFQKFSNILCEIKTKADQYYEDTFEYEGLDPALKEMLMIFKEKSLEVYNLSNKIGDYAGTLGDLTKTQ